MIGAVRHPLHDRVVQAMSTRAITVSMVAVGILAAMSMSLAPSAMGAVAKPAKAAAPAGPLPTTTAEKIAWCRANDAKGS